MPPDFLEFALPDSGSTENLGTALARAFLAATTGQVGAVVHLSGELGSGKTTCVRSLLRTLGVGGTVRSPTYTLVDTYLARNLTCVHVDLYRLRSSVEVEELGLRDMTGPGHLMMIEWPEKGGAAVPRADLGLQLEYAGDSRLALLRAVSGVGEAWLDQLLLDNSLSPYVSNLT